MTAAHAAHALAQLLRDADRAALVGRPGVVQRFPEAVPWQGRRFRTGRATASERRHLEQIAAGDARRAPANFLKSFRLDERVIVERRGVGLAWIIRTC